MSEEYYISYSLTSNRSATYCRCSIGHLSDTEIALFEQESRIAEEPHYALECANAIPLSSPEERYAHHKALEQFNEDHRTLELLAESFHGQPVTKVQHLLPKHILVMQRFMQIADIVRKASATDTPGEDPDCLIKDAQETAEEVQAAHKTEAVSQITGQNAQVQPNQIAPTSKPPKQNSSKLNKRKSCSRETHEKKLRDCIIDFVNRSTLGEKVKLGELADAYGLRPEVFRKHTKDGKLSKGYKLMQAAQKVVMRDRKGHKDETQDFILKLLEKRSK